MSERVLDGEVVLVIENSDDLVGGGGSIGRGGGVVATFRRDGNGGQVNLLRHLGGFVRVVWW